MKFKNWGPIYNRSVQTGSTVASPKYVPAVLPKLEKK